MTIAEIKNIILAEKAKHRELDGLNSPSKVAIYNLWAYVIAVVAWTQYQFFEVFKTELNEQIAAQKLYTLRWFRDAACLSSWPLWMKRPGPMLILAILRKRLPAPRSLSNRH